MYVYSNFGVSLPHNAAAQQSCTTPVPSGQEQPGDLVFFGTPAYHVGLYVGGGSMVNAPYTGAYVSYGSVAGAAGFGRP
jgi:cell wall-associated NlpC family hydrolase